ncbi:MAG: prepilin-type N-terminal cleavage/methylation domain-containing protein [Nibricoccus sp.]
MVHGTSLLRQQPPKSRSTRKQNGFTLIEVALAGFILAVVLGLSLLSIGKSFESIDTARCTTYASQIMQSEFEKMRLTPWGNGTTAGTGTNGVTAYSISPTTVDITNYVTSSDFGSRMHVTRTASDVHTGMIKVTLNISWQSYTGRDHARTFVTYYGRNGLYDYFSSP